MSHRFFVLGILRAAAAVLLLLPPAAIAGQASQALEPPNSCLSEDPCPLLAMRPGKSEDVQSPSHG